MAVRARRPTRAQAAGLAALAVGAGLSLLDPWPLPLGLALSPAALPLLLFLVLCVAAPFFPGWSFFLPVVTRGSRARAAVALSFDDGPDPAVTPALLDLLARHRTRASFFVVGRNALEQPALMTRLREEGHEVGNHSMGHDPLLMLRPLARLEREVAECQAVLQAQGFRPLAFRPPVGITNPRLPGVLERLGLECVCFSCRPRDFGNRTIDRLAAKVLGAVRPGDIVLLHDVAPRPPATAEAWLREVEGILEGLKARGLSIVPLSELLGRPLTAPTPEGAAARPQEPGPARAGLARG